MFPQQPRGPQRLLGGSVEIIGASACETRAMVERTLGSRVATAATLAASVLEWALVAATASMARRSLRAIISSTRQDTSAELLGR